MDVKYKQKKENKMDDEEKKKKRMVPQHRNKKENEYFCEEMHSALDSLYKALMDITYESENLNKPYKEIIKKAGKELADLTKAVEDNTTKLTKLSGQSLAHPYRLLLDMGDAYSTIYVYTTLNMEDYERRVDFLKDLVDETNLSVEDAERVIHIRPACNEEIFERDKNAVGYIRIFPPGYFNE